MLLFGQMHENENIIRFLLSVVNKDFLQEFNPLQNNLLKFREEIIVFFRGGGA